MADAQEPVAVAFEPASSSTEAEWLSSALRHGQWTRVSAVIPSGFEAYAVLRHPAYRCVSARKNLVDIRYGKYIRSETIRWSEVAKSDLPVVYGRTSYEESVDGMTRGTQYRRLPDGKWVRDILAIGGLSQVVQDGDEWIEGPEEGCLEPELARSLQRILVQFTVSSDPCWFGIWEGFGFLSDSQRQAPMISTKHRSWLLFRAPLAAMEQSFFPDCSGHYPANLVWPEDRSWCVATGIDLEATYVCGSEELIAAVLEDPSLESERVSIDDPLAMLRDLLQPVVEKPPDIMLREGFEARESPHRFSPPRLTRMQRLVNWLLSWGWKRQGNSFEFRAYKAPKKRRPPGGL